MKFTEWVIAVLAMLLCGFIFAIALLDWVGGCGEVIHTSTGTVQGECLGRDFIKELKGKL